ncbi:unnamed protein product [Orchesella dallaii]|uniref:Ig-like domain-containing protein n=1 Tax=Orchesella dallaii TaxID=48710 RepID=A0ABP1QPU2_9HEXA
MSQCTWTFLPDYGADSNSTFIQHETDCVETKRGNKTTKTQDFFYEGYVQVPNKAVAIVCGVNETINNGEILSLQKVALAPPPHRYIGSSGPSIVLQRFSNDYSVRLGVHDVTNEMVTIDGNEVESIKLLCISRNNVEWTNYTMPKQRVIKQLNSRDKEWLTSKASDEAKIWKHYIALSQREEMLSTTGLVYNYTDNDTIHIVPLTILTLTESSSRKYECRENNEDLKTTRSAYIKLHVQNPRFGPDEILLIQQIIALIDGMSKGERKEPWATLGTILTIILLLFVYYCKKKLDQSSSQTPKPPEETEMKVTLRESRRAQTIEHPVDSTVNEVQTQTNN